MVKARRLTSLACSAAAALGIGACGGENDSTATAGQGPDAKQVSVAVQMPFSAIGYYQRVQAGAEAAAEEDGAVDLEVQAPAELNPSAAQQQALNMAAQQPDGIALVPFPPELWRGTLGRIAGQVDHALALNIELGATAEQAASSPVKTYVGSNESKISDALARETIGRAGLGPETNGTVLVGQCVPGESGALAELSAGFAETAAELLPQAEIVRFDSKPVHNANVAAWRTQIQRNEDVVLTFGPCDQDTQSVLQLKRRLGGDFASAISTPSLEALEAIDEGLLTAAGFTASYEQGYIAVELLSAAARGDALPEGWIDVGFTIATQDNAKDVQAGFREESYAAYYQPGIDEILDDLDAKVRPIADAYR